MGWGGGGGIINRMYIQASSCASLSSTMDVVVTGNPRIGVSALLR